MMRKTKRKTIRKNDGRDPKSDDSGDTVIVTSTDEEDRENMEVWKITGKSDEEGLD